jgi:hypothetical protein
MAVQTRIQMRRGELTGASGWVALNPTLSAGEWGLDTTTKRYKIGDGLTPWNSLAYSSILPSNTDLIGASGIGLSFSSVTGVPITISVTGIQSSQVNDFASAVNTLINSETIQDIIGVSVTGVSGIAVSYNDTTGYTTISLSDPTIQVSDITNFASGVNSLIDSAVSTSIVGGSGIDIVYNSGNNTLTVSSPLTAGSGISLSHSSGNYVVSLSDPTVQLADVTDLSANARTFLLTPSSNNLSTLVTDETGSGALVFANNPTLVGPTLGNASATTINNVAITNPAGTATLTLASAKTFTVSNTLTLTGTDDSSVAFGSGGTVVYTSNKLNALSSTSSSELAGVISDETGTGSLVFGTNPTISSGILAGTSSMDVFNTTATTVNAFGAASTLNMGPSSGSQTTINIAAGTLGVNNGRTINLGTGPFSGLSATSINIGTGSITGGSSSVNVNIGATGLGTSTTTIRNNLVANGNLTVSGSGLVASNINNFDSQVRTSRLDQMAVPTASVSLNSQKITNLANPTADQDAATKAYVDATRSGLDVKQSVRVATTNQNVFMDLSGLQTIDGVSLVAGDRILVKDSIGTAQNGIYVVAAGAWSRATDADSSAKVTAGMFTFVTEGILNADSGWVLTTDDTITLDTTALVFAQFSGAGQITAGDGMVKSGNTLNVGTASSSRIVVNADNIDLATVSRTDSGSGNVVVGVTTDSYGRVTSVASGLIPDASTTVKGIASFDSGDFSVSSGAVSIKSGGVDNGQLVNSAVTIGSTSVSLGGTAVSVSGLTSVSSTTFVGALSGNASTATTLQTVRTINGTSFNGSADITISFVYGGTP